jgi:hypothetical protein
MAKISAGLSRSLATVDGNVRENKQTGGSETKKNRDKHVEQKGFLHGPRSLTGSCWVSVMPGIFSESPVCAEQQSLDRQPEHRPSDGGQFGVHNPFGQLAASTPIVTVMTLKTITKSKAS